MSQVKKQTRNFNTVSPSARWILLMKGHTDIPYAREAAKIVQHPEAFAPDFNNRDLGFWGRTSHFESRYRSLDQLLSDIPVNNILELSSGFSFRGLDLTERSNVYYIDTDLPDLVATKRQIIAELGSSARERKGVYELEELNALDQERFEEFADRFPAGEIAIINEGLLMYLDEREKEKLCGIIRGILKKRGGYWITGDIYLKLEGRDIDLALDEKSKKFFEEHRVEENKFTDFEEAENFFKRMGFVIDKEAESEYQKLTSFPYFLKSATAEQMEKIKKTEKIHSTWRLRLA